MMNFIIRILFISIPYYPDAHLGVSRGDVKRGNTQLGFFPDRHNSWRSTYFIIQSGHCPEYQGSEVLNGGEPIFHMCSPDPLDFSLYYRILGPRGLKFYWTSRQSLTIHSINVQKTTSISHPLNIRSGLDLWQTSALVVLTRVTRTSTTRNLSKYISSQIAKNPLCGLSGHGSRKMFMLARPLN